MYVYKATNSTDFNYIRFLCNSSNVGHQTKNLTKLNGDFLKVVFVKKRLKIKRKGVEVWDLTQKEYLKDGQT